jgi:hypothetical protein
MKPNLNPLGWFNEPFEEPGTSIEELKEIYPNAKLSDLQMLQKQLEDHAKNPAKFIQDEPKDGLPEIQVLATAFDNQKPKMYDGKKLNKPTNPTFKPGDLREVKRPVNENHNMNGRYVVHHVQDNGNTWENLPLLCSNNFLTLVTEAANYSIETSRDVGVFDLHLQHKLVALLNGSVH